MQLSTSYNMSSTFNDASMIVNQSVYLDAVIRGLLIQPSQSVDQFVVTDLWNQLFKYYIESITNKQYIIELIFFSKGLSLKKAVNQLALMLLL